MNKKTASSRKRLEEGGDS